MDNKEKAPAKQTRKRMGLTPARLRRECEALVQPNDQVQPRREAASA